MHKVRLVKRCSVTHFLELFHSLVQSGFTVTAALKVLEKNEAAGTYAVKINEAVLYGKSISEAICGISRKLKSFGTMINTAEETGEIESALEEITEELKESEEDKKNLTGILVYPVCMCVLAFSLSIVFMVYGPPYINLIAEVNEKELIKTIAAANMWLVFSAAVFFATVRYISHRYDFEYLVLRNLYYMTKSSAGMEESFLILLKEDSFSKGELKSISFMLNGLREGRKLYELAGKTGKFDEFCLSWLYVSEESGEMLRGLKTVRDHYKNRRRKNREFMQRVTEPAITAICGIYILILITGCIVPVFMSLGSKLL